MKKILLLLLFLLIMMSCNGQKDKDETNKKTEKKLITKKYIMKKFDIALFNKNQESGVWSFSDKSGNKVEQTKIGDDGYTIETNFKDKVFILSESYHNNGIFAGEGINFPRGFLKGIWVFSNEKGEITKKVDYDKPYENYPWEKVEAYLISRKVNLKDNYTKVWREENNDGIFWMVSWDAQKLSKIGTKTITNIVIDVKAQKIIPIMYII
ncbi:hypothetical protein [Flavobacterium sp.]|uniref:hypothetical protein n=1 Tax=Flavobacterium sp. TaxID=239 RepID=UPI00286C912D|nr:hypothetical protein [Flavobacterium sp.]